MLYHGTLISNVPNIEERGLVPLVGSFTRNAYGQSAIPAVFMADEGGLERVVHAMVAAMMNEICEDEFERYLIGADYQLNDELFFEHGAIFVIEKTAAILPAGSGATDEPAQAEDGDYYSLETVSPVRKIVGDDLREFLDERGLTPSDVNDFVDPRSKLKGAATAI